MAIGKGMLETAVLIGLLATALTPNARADMIAWYRGDQATTNGTLVTSWTDQATSDGQQNATDKDTPLRDPVYHASGFGTLDRAYLEFTGSDYLETASGFFSGVNPRTIAVAYRVDAAGTNKACTVAGQIDPSNYKSFFMQSRGLSGPGSPYLAGWNSDLSSGIAPVAERITFAVGSYNGTTGLLTWAFEDGTTSSVSDAKPWNTTSVAFRIGADTSALDRVMFGDIAEVRVYNTALTPAEHNALIQELQDYYYVPEPGTSLLLALGGLALIRRRRTV